MSSRLLAAAAAAVAALALATRNARALERENDARRVLAARQVSIGGQRGRSAIRVAAVWAAVTLGVSAAALGLHLNSVEHDEARAPRPASMPKSSPGRTVGPSASSSTKTTSKRH